MGGGQGLEWDAPSAETLQTNFSFIKFEGWKASSAMAETEPWTAYAITAPLATALSSEENELKQAFIAAMNTNSSLKTFLEASNFA